MVFHSDIEDEARQMSLARADEWERMSDDDKLWQARATVRRAVVCAWEEIVSRADRILTLNHVLHSRRKVTPLGLLGHFELFDFIKNRDVEALWNAMTCERLALSALYESYVENRNSFPGDYDGEDEKAVAKDVASIYLASMESIGGDVRFLEMPAYGLPVVTETRWLRRFQEVTGADLMLDSYFSGVPVEMVTGTKSPQMRSRMW